MRAGLGAAAAAAAVVMLAPGAADAPAAERPYPWERRVGSASDYARERRGRVAFAVVGATGRVRGRHMHERHRSASVVKAMLLVAYLNQRSVRGRALGRRDQELLEPMITRSDNDAATDVRKIVGDGALVRLAQRAGMKDYSPARSWGGTQISAYDQARLFWRIDSFLPTRHREYARSLLAGVVPSQRWGVPPAVPQGWSVYFKGGWKPPQLVNQSALLEHGEARVAIAVLTDGDPSFRYGRATITGVARRLLARVDAFAL